MAWYYFIGTVSDHTSIKTVIARLDISVCQCGSIYSLKWRTTAEVLPLLTPVLLPSGLPLPFISQRFCSSGLDWECNCFPWKSIIPACWLGYKFGRLSCKKETCLPKFSCFFVVFISVVFWSANYNFAYIITKLAMETPSLLPRIVFKRVKFMARQYLLELSIHVASFRLLPRDHYAVYYM